MTDHQQHREQRRDARARARVTRRGARVESLRWPGLHGTVGAAQGPYVYVRWDGTLFTEDEVPITEVRPSRRRAPRDTGPGYAIFRDTRGTGGDLFGGGR